MNGHPLPDHTVLLVAPVYNRTGYGILARTLASIWHRQGLRIRTVPVNEVDAGVDDVDMDWLRSLEATPVQGRLAAVFFHVPGQPWLEVPLPPGCARIMYTTFDSAAQGHLPPPEWIRVCLQMDQLWLLSEEERPAWIQAGMDPRRIRVLPVPHGWIENPTLPPAGQTPRADLNTFRFLCISMFLPRRRWDTLLEAFLEEFREEPGAELYLKVSYPSWHPVPGQPKRDLEALIAGLKARIPSRARITLDESPDTRLGICRLIDGCQVYVSTDTCFTAPMVEALVRGKRTLVPASLHGGFPEDALFRIEEDPGHTGPMTEAMLAYQPHHRDRRMPLLQVEAVRRALRQAFETSPDWLALPWKLWRNFILRQAAIFESRGWVEALEALWIARETARPAVRWEGTQFVYHSLAHVNRQLCLGLLREGAADLSLVPYERDQFDGAAHPAFRPLAERVNLPLPGPAAVHVRHQWPPNFTPPPEGCWVMIQPWEFGGIPAAWVDPMRDRVDELWVPTPWVKQAYVASGIPEDKVQVIPNGVDGTVFRPDGDPFPLRTRKAFRFLFLGGTLPRKGIDLLLKAYLTTFRAPDDVCLVIKGQGGTTYRGTDLHQVLAELGGGDPQAPEVEYLTDDLEEPALAALYRTCQAFVLPYRGEGFGLPIAEAMASGLPVVVTGQGAARAFVEEAWGYRLPSRPIGLSKVDNLAPSQAGFWLEEPDPEALAATLRWVYEHPEEARRKGARGRRFALRALGWDHAVHRIIERLEHLAGRTPCRLQPPAPAPPTRRVAFLYEPDWSQAEWVEVLMSHLQAFAPGDPVALVFLMDPSRPGVPPLARAQEAVLDLVARTGQQAFPDVILVEAPADLPELLRGFHSFRWIPRGRGACEGLEDDPLGARLARERRSLTASKPS